MKTLEGTTYILPYDEFDKLVKDHFDFLSDDWSFAAVKEASNGSDYLYEKMTRELNKYEQREVDDCRANKRYSVYTNTMLRILVIDGILPEGNYIIEVSW